jgi:hypothetical protein
MPETDKPVFADKDKKPDEDSIFAVLGDASRLWKQIIDGVKKDYSDITEEWNFYNDGKQWLYKLNRKKKTLYWIRVLEGTFTVTFWFGDKAEPLINNSKLPDRIKQQFKMAKRYNKIRGITLQMADQSDVEIVLQMVALKTSMK